MMNPNEKARLSARADILKALAHPTRLWIAEQLGGGERCVCEFVDQIEADFSTISKHLAVLKQAGLVTAEKRGKQVYYTLKVPCVLKFMHCVEEVISNNAREQADRLHEKKFGSGFRRVEQKNE